MTNQKTTAGPSAVSPLIAATSIGMTSKKQWPKENFYLKQKLSGGDGGFLQFE